MRKLEDKILLELSQILGDKYVITDKEKMYNYAFSTLSSKIIYPLGVLLPKNVSEISLVMKYCYENEVNITVRGGGSNVSGGALSSGNDIILSLERLNTIVEVNKIDRTITVESGVVTEKIYEEALKHNLIYPQNISSSSQSFIGGNIALSSGSPNSLKYGSIKNTVLNLEVVLPNGQTMWTGKNVTKNATGYNFTQLFIGSEGTLGIITKAVLKLEIPIETVLLLIPFSSISKLFDFVNAFFENGFNAVSMEFIDKNGYELVSNFLNKKNQFGNAIEGILWIEYELHTKHNIEDLYIFISTYTNQEILFAENEADKKRLWEHRKRIGDASINYSIFKDIDIVVPRCNSFLIYNEINAVCNRFNFYFIIVGHIGDGNFHVNIFKDKSINWEKNMDACLTHIFQAVNKYGGTISGEHGIGSLYNPYLKLVMPEYQINLMKQIKYLFDPKNILNAHLIF